MDKQQTPSPPVLKVIPPNRLVTVGGPVDRVRVSLRVFGDDLDPVEVTTLLGCQPTEARRRGEVIPDPRYHRTARTGCWLLDGADEPSTELEAQVGNLLGRLTDDVVSWRDLSRRFRVDVFCGVFLDSFNRGFALSPKLMRRLADQGIEIGFDIYSAEPADVVEGS